MISGGALCSTTTTDDSTHPDHSDVGRVCRRGAGAAEGGTLQRRDSKISDHVWVMMGNPNIAIIVGTRGTLVVDTGLGAPNGEVIARTAQKLSPAGAKLYLTTRISTRSMRRRARLPREHRPDPQHRSAEEFELNGLSMVDTFSKRGPEQAQWLSTATSARLTFSSKRSEAGSRRCDGPPALVRRRSHQRRRTDLRRAGRTLISGDVVQNKTMRISSATVARLELARRAG